MCGWIARTGGALLCFSAIPASVEWALIVVLPHSSDPTGSSRSRALERSRINRRAALNRLVQAASTCAVVEAPWWSRAARAGQAAEPAARITVLLDEPIGVIKPAALLAVRGTHRGSDLRRPLGRSRFQGPQSGRHPPRARRPLPSARERRRPLARRVFCRPISLARWDRPARDAAAPLRPLARGDRTEPVRHPRIPSLLPARGGRALSGRQRRYRLGRGVPAVGRVLQRPGRPYKPGR